MNLSEKVRMLRIEQGLSQDELAKRMGYSSRSSINKIENGRPVSQKIIAKLAEALGVSAPYLMGFEDKKPESNLDSVLSSMVPVRIFDPISCGKGLMVDELAVGCLALPAEALSSYHEYFSNRAEGDSMEPKIRNGDYIVFEKTPIIQPGEIGAFSLNDEYYCKRLKKNSKGEVFLVSENVEYEPILVEPEDDFRVLGKFKFRITNR